jgi:O-methyltransferase
LRFVDADAAIQHLVVVALVVRHTDAKKSEMNQDYISLINKYGLISDQVDTKELLVVLRELGKSLEAPGAVVEFGCYIGTTSLNADTRGFHVYDSFEGLPTKSSQDQSPLGIQFKEGELTATKKQFIQEFKKAKLAQPHIHKGWFDQIQPSDVPSEIAFAFLDGDYYKSIKSSLLLIESKLTPGAIIVVDDYANEALPGAAKAINEWCYKNGHIPKVEHSLAIIHCR